MILTKSFEDFGISLLLLRLQVCLDQTLELEKLIEQTLSLDDKDKAIEFFNEWVSAVQKVRTINANVLLLRKRKTRRVKNGKY